MNLNIIRLKLSELTDTEISEYCRQIMGVLDLKNRNIQYENYDDTTAFFFTDLQLTDRLNHTPDMLSGGQKQRVAVAGALIQKPEILFADEPTGNLDDESSEELMQMLSEIHLRSLSTIVLVTHDNDIIRYADRKVHLEKGRLI